MNPTLKSRSILLQAFEGQNTRVPVWFMRQAGRFLPEYQKIRRAQTLDQMFQDPQIVAQVTCLPVDILQVDAAILFADILTLPQHLGFKITFDPMAGPVIQNPFSGARDLQGLHDLDDVSYVREAIQLINKTLADDIPLIGFAGSPFTVLCYLVEGGSSTAYRKVFQLAYGNPDVFHQLMQFLTENTIRYLRLQQEAGIQVFQLFDSWGGILPQAQYEALVLPYVQKIFQDVDLFSIYYLRNARHLLDSMLKAGSDFISVCETVDLASEERLTNTELGVQGNLFNGFLYAPDRDLQAQVLRVLSASQRFKKYIFNLNHGIFQDTAVSKVQLVVDLVKKFPK